MAYKKNFSPWRKNLAIMMGALFGATYLAAGAIQHGGSIQSLLIFPLLLLVHYSYKMYLKRVHGKRVEKRAQKALIFAAKKVQWNVRVNIPCAYGGDIDAAVETAVGRKFTIEIKSWMGLKVARGKLVKLNGRALTKDPIKQSLNEAATIGGSPVIWMPDARKRQRMVFRGVLIVMGPAKFLIKILESA